MNVIQHAWVSFVLSVAETLILYWLCSNFLHRNLRPMSQYTVGILIYFIFQWVTYWFNAPLFSMCVFYCAFTMLVSCIFFTDSLRTKVLVAYLFVVLNYACKLLSAVLLRFLHNEPLPSEPNFLIQSPLAQMTACILFFFFTLLFILCRNMRKSNKATLYNAISFLVSSVILFITIQIFHMRNSVSHFYLEISGILFCSSMFLFYLVDDYAIINEESQKNMIADKLLTMQSSYYQKVEDSQREITSLRHDLKKHLHSLVVFLKAGQYEEALTYIEQIYESANGMKVPLTGGNSMVNILVNNAQQQAAACCVPLTANIMVPPELPFENVDLCIILGNLLDNALEACCRMGKGANRFIHTEIRCQKAFLIISISNSYNGQLRIEGNRYESIKIGEQYCGIGLSNVSTVIHKYNGDMKISHNNDVFTVSVMLPLVCRETPAAASSVQVNALTLSASRFLYRQHQPELGSMTGRTPVAGLDPSSHVLHGSARDGKPDSKIPFIALIKPLKQMGNLFFIQTGPIVLYTDSSPFPLPFKRDCDTALCISGAVVHHILKCFSKQGRVCTDPDILLLLFHPNAHLLRYP